MFDRLSAALALRRLRWKNISCPICNSDTGRLLIARDRYLLTVNIRQCVQCGHIYTARNLSSEDIGVFYKNIYRHVYEDADIVTPEYLYQSKDKLKAAYRYSQIAKSIGTIDGVVEIGSGLGFFLRECIDHGVEQVIGFEPHTTFCQYAVNALGLGGKVFNKMYEDHHEQLPKANLFVLFHVLEHLENPLHLLSWIAKHIDDGWLVIEVPDIEKGWESLGLFNFHFGHRHYFSIETLALLLGKAGFGVVSYSSKQDDGIYPGNLRILARARSLPEADFIEGLPQRHQAIGDHVLRHGRALGLKNGAIRAALRLIKP